MAQLYDRIGVGYGRRPHAYLEARVRSAISSFEKLPRAELEQGLARLRADLESGAWQRRHRALLECKEVDLGYRLVVAELRASGA